MKKQIKITAIALLSTLALSCNMKTSDKAELEKLKAVEAAAAEPQTVIVEKEVYVDQPATVNEKKKMSGALKGALIGAGAGAATGAVVSKKPGKGAIIGGVIGAAGGAVAGDVIENNKAKKE